jgi:hypothetical protein
VDHGKGSSSRFKKKKKKKKNDKRRRDDNLVMVVECKASRPKSNLTKASLLKDHFKRLLEAPCTHHEVPVKNALKDCRVMKNYVNNTLKPKVAYPQKKVAPSPTTMATTQELSTQARMERSI